MDRTRSTSMTVYESPAIGFTSLSWEPPPNWVRKIIAQRQGINRLYTILAMRKRDQAFYTVKLNGKFGSELNLRIQVLMKRAEDKVLHICGSIDTRPGTGWHPYWAVLYFDERSGGEIAIQQSTINTLWI